MENDFLIFDEYRIVAITNEGIMELEDDFTSLEQAQESIPYWQEKYPDYKIDIEKY